MSSPLSQLFESARARALTAGEALFHQGAEVRDMMLVESGRVDLIRHGATGGRMILQRAGPGAVLAEASAYAAQYHCDGVAAQAAIVRVVSRSAFLAALAADPALATTWAAYLAHAVQAARMRAEIRGLTTVAARLEAWFAAGNRLPPRGHWQDVADEIGVSREALYRALARAGKKGGPMDRPFPA
jgi:CRP-like cAMP-binding protein